MWVMSFAWGGIVNYKVINDKGSICISMCTICGASGGIVDEEKKDKRLYSELYMGHQEG